MYCNNCGKLIPDFDKFCKKCGTQARPTAQQNEHDNASGQVYHTPMDQYYQPPVQQPAYEQAPPVQQASITLEDRGVYGRFGGLMIFGAILIITLVVGMLMSEHFLNGRNLDIIGMQIIILLPVAFAVGLTVKHKGLDFSFPAMVALTSAICCITHTFAVGILISLLACIIIGAINSVGIHFLKLPGLPVTIVTFIIVSFISKAVVKPNAMNRLDVDHRLMYVAVIIAVIVAVAIALVSSIGKNHRNKFWSTLLVYAGSGIMAVLYFAALSIRMRAAMPYYSTWDITTILIIAVFVGITRFFKSKALGIVFAIIPAIFIAFLNNVFNLTGVLVYYQQLGILGLLIVLLFLLFYRGRAQVIGQSLDKRYSVKSWIVFIPLILLLLKEVIIAVVITINLGMPSPLYGTLTAVYFDVILLLIAIGACIVHALVKPKGASIV